MTIGYLLLIAVPLGAAIAAGLFAIAVRDPERYRARFLGPTLVTALATYLASGVWWAAATTMRRAIAPYLVPYLSSLSSMSSASMRAMEAKGLGGVAPIMALENVARVTDPAIIVAAISGLIGLFAWWLPELVDRLGRERRSVSRL